MFGEIPGYTVEAWPAGVPVQVHYTKDDPFREEQALLDRFEASVRASGSAYEFHEYPGAGHLFTDQTLPNEYDGAAVGARGRLPGGHRAVCGATPSAKTLT
jgi:dienelactone hydrolase